MDKVWLLILAKYEPIIFCAWNQDDGDEGSKNKSRSKNKSKDIIKKHRRQVLFSGIITALGYSSIWIEKKKFATVGMKIIEFLMDPFQIFNAKLLDQLLEVAYVCVDDLSMYFCLGKNLCNFRLVSVY